MLKTYLHITAVLMLHICSVHHKYSSIIYSIFSPYQFNSFLSFRNVLHPSGTVPQYQDAFQLVQFYGDLKNEG